MATKRPYVPRTTGSAPKQHVDADRLIVGAGLDDTNSNEAVDIAATASAVNHLQITNAATGNDVGLEAVGDDTNIGLDLKTKGSGTVKFNGTAAILSNLTGTEDADHLAKFDSNGDIVDFEIGDLTSKATPTTSDQVIIADAAASNALKRASFPAANDPHLVVKLQSGQGTWSNMPAALTTYREFGYETGGQFDLSHGYSTVRLVGVVATQGFAGATYRLQYSTDNGSSWDYFDSDGANSGPALDIATATGFVASSAVTMDAASKADVRVRLVGIGGNATADPQVAEIYAEFR